MSSDSLHRVVLHTASRKLILAGPFLAFLESAFKNLSARYPGLKVVERSIYPDRVEMLLDFQRLDEDLLRVVQSFKSEVKNLARKGGFKGGNLWERVTTQVT
jgi:hypothetical protein